MCDWRFSEREATDLTNFWQIYPRHILFRAHTHTPAPESFWGLSQPCPLLLACQYCLPVFCHCGCGFSVALYSWQQGRRLSVTVPACAAVDCVRCTEQMFSVVLSSVPPPLVEIWMERLVLYPEAMWPHTVPHDNLTLGLFWGRVSGSSGSHLLSH